jgi:hypothetical protein
MDRYQKLQRQNTTETYPPPSVNVVQKNNVVVTIINLP